MYGNCYRVFSVRKLAVQEPRFVACPRIFGYNTYLESIK
ncbi:hypothetical protein D3OALGB2SA_3138 [Olavius algarvensis associated proteobacterium Delta 3]|nr:hypothetical protein D3OALGB2SA_3138 [Olavius algarvensis associated proteobacterium Delta 3]